MRPASLVAVAATAVAVTGCGNNAEHANKPRPPAPLLVSVALTPKVVTITPRVMTAGQVLFTITNQSGKSQRLEISNDPYSSSSYDETTDSIQNDSTTNFSTTLRTGTYQLTVADGGLEPITLVIGKKRMSSSSELLLP